MTEKKRYTYKDLHYMGMNEMLELVNGLLDENEQLKQTNQELYDELQETMSYKSLKMGEVSILKKENEQLKQQLNDNLQFLIRSAERLGFESLDHLLHTLDKGEITGYSTLNYSHKR